MWPLGNMVWRIGDVLDVDAQLDWIEQAGFEAVSFHASPGVPGQWRGVDPAATGRHERARLRRRLAAFAMCEIHAPFAHELVAPDAPAVVTALRPTLALAGDVGAAIVTVHGAPPTDARASDRHAWEGALHDLDAMAAQSGVTIGLELVRGFRWLDRARWARVGVTLDVGHLYLDDGAGYRPYGSIAAVVHAHASLLVHVHLHDYDGTHDHIELGTGRVDVDTLLGALDAVGYGGALCLELNPGRVDAAGIRRSAAWVRAKAADRGAG